MSYLPTKQPAQRIDPRGQGAALYAESVHSVPLPPKLPKRSRRQGTIRSMDMRLAIFLSVMAHIFSPVILLAITLVFMIILGMDITDFFSKPEPKPQDLEFVLVPPQQDAKPLNPETRYRAETNSRAGGEHDPFKKVVIAETPTATSPAVQPKPQPQVQPQPKQPQPVAEQPKPKPPQPKPVVQAAKPLPTSVKAVEPPPLPKVAAASVMASTPLPPVEFEATPVAQSAPTFGELSNPGPGNKTAPPGVDALKEPDFGPYMKDLQRRIKQSWVPPRGNESKRVVVVFRVSREGKLLETSVSKSSGVAMADNAAIAAIQKTFPFRAFPSEFEGDNIVIEFTFDYNVFGDKKRMGKRAS